MTGASSLIYRISLIIEAVFGTRQRRCRGAIKPSSAVSFGDHGFLVELERTITQ